MNAAVGIRGPKGGESKPKAPYEAADSLQSTAKDPDRGGQSKSDENSDARNIYLDNTPLAKADGGLNFAGVTLDWRPGSVEQSYIRSAIALNTRWMWLLTVAPMLRFCVRR